MRIRTGILATALAATALAPLAGCSKNKKAHTKAATGDSSSLVSKVDPTLCETSGKNVITYDLNRDNRPDVWKMYKVDDQGGTKVELLTCKQVDFDHDGRKDWVVGYTPRGSNAYEKADFDYDGRFDMSAVYDPKTGKRIEVERDSDFDGKYDIKEVYDRFETLTAVRRDRNADGEPDYWEQYKDGALVAILYDDDYDKKVKRQACRALPVQPDGGLKCFGHPIGASGIRMLYEPWLQFQGRAGKRQIKDPKLALAHNMGNEPYAPVVSVCIVGL